LSLLPPPERQRFLASLSDEESAELEYNWQGFWARRNQIEPAGEWNVWLVLSGRGFGKTRTGAEWVRASMCGPTPLAAGRYSHVALVAETAADARDVMVGDGKNGVEASGLLQVHPPAFRPHYEPSKRRLTWPNGAVASIFNATEPEQLRGPQFDAAWCDELAKWQYAQETWDMLQFGLRTGSRPRVVITTTPKPISLVKQLVADDATVITRGSTFDNASNLAPTFLRTIREKYAGTRLGRQELDAEILDDVPGALWTRAQLDALRVKAPPEMRRVVVAIDPSGASGDEDDAGSSIGIVVAGLGVDGHGYVLADRTCMLSPAGWGRRAVDAYHEFSANLIVAEKNFGGAMVEHVIRTVDKRAPVKLVTASRGKVARAEPIAALYEQNRIKHVGAFADLEDQMVAFKTDGYVGGGSPDRADALVWAMAELMLTVEQTVAVIQTGFY